MRARKRLAWLLVLLAASLVACGGGGDEAQKVTIEAKRDGVFTLSVEGERHELAAPQQDALDCGNPVYEFTVSTQSP